MNNDSQENTPNQPAREMNDADMQSLMNEILPEQNDVPRTRKVEASPAEQGSTPASHAERVGKANAPYVGGRGNATDDDQFAKDAVEGRKRASRGGDQSPPSR